MRRIHTTRTTFVGIRPPSEDSFQPHLFGRPSNKESAENQGFEKCDHRLEGFRIFADGRCTEEERAELQGIMETICGRVRETLPAETYSTSIPLDDPLPGKLLVAGQDFAITGRFAYGTRRKVFETIQSLGGRPSDSPPTHYTR